jgi:hypothetical protein
MIDNVPDMSENKIGIGHAFNVFISKTELLKNSTKAHPNLDSINSRLDDSIFYLSFYCAKYNAHINSSVLIRSTGNAVSSIRFDTIESIITISGSFFFNSSSKNLREIESLGRNELVNLINSEFICKLNDRTFDKEIFLDSKALIDSYYKK